MLFTDLFNSWLPSYVCSILSSKSRNPMCMSTQSPSFCRDELQRALGEQAFGIKSFSVINSMPHEASASVELLEGRKLFVCLATRGYFVQDIDKNSKSSTASQELMIYESIEDLLHSISPLFTQRQRQTLFAALERLA